MHSCLLQGCYSANLLRIDMETVEVVNSEKKPRDGFALVGKIIAGIIVATLLAVAVWQCQGYKSEAERLRTENTEFASIILSLKTKMERIIAVGNRYKAQRDSAFAATDSAVEKLTYAQKVAEYFRGVLANRTITAAELGKNPKLTDERVVTAGLKTIQHERVLRTTGDSLYNALGVLNVKILDFETDKFILKNGLVNIQNKALSNVSGGVWPLNHKRRKQNKEIALQAGQVIQSVQQREKSAITPNTPITPVHDPNAVSDLENAVNKP